MKGSYVLIMQLSEPQIITIGSLQNVHFSRGYYAYVGSAMGGVESRLSHHLRKSKKPHWHIDYLRQKASIVDISICRTEGRAECAIAQALGSQFDSITGFGCSDCRCHSHLFFSTDEGQLKTNIAATLEPLARHHL